MRRFIFGLSVIISAAFILLFSLSVDAVQQTDISATRTAIAITREPILGTPATPSSIDLTATVAFQEEETRLPMEYGVELEASASAIVFLATQTIHVLTGTPLPTLTPLSTATELPCQLTFYKNINLTDTYQLNNRLRRSNSTLEGFFTVFNITLETPYNCLPESHFIRTDVEVSLSVKKLQDDNLIIAALEELLLHLQEPVSVKDGQSLRLLIEFYVNQEDCEYRKIDTGFTNAQLAYKEGLRGESLIEALGGIMDTNQDLGEYCLTY